MLYRGCDFSFVSSSISLRKIHDYLSPLRHSQTFSGALGLGYIRQVVPSPPAQRQAHNAVEPSSDKSLGAIQNSRKYVVEYIETKAKSLESVGDNIGSNPTISQAADLARDTGTCAITGAIRFVKDHQALSSVLMMLPVYKDNHTPSTVAARRQRVLGWIYMPLAMKDVVKTLSQGVDPDLDVRIFAGNNATQQVQFFQTSEDDGHNLVHGSHTDFAESMLLPIAGRAWMVQMRASSMFFKQWETWHAWIIGVCGCVLSAMAGFIVWLFGRQRTVAEKLAEKMTESLGKSELRFRTAVEGGLSAFFLFQSVRDGDGAIVDFEFVEVNNRGLEMLRRPREKVIGGKLCDLLPVNHAHGFFDKYRRVVETGQPIDEQFEVDLPHCQGCWLHQEVVRADDGIAITSTDITERKTTERELRKLSQAVEQAASSIVITDTQGTIEFVNPAFTRNSGYQFEEVVGQNPRVLQGGDMKPDGYQRLWSQITAGDTWRGEFHNRRKDGSLFWESATIAPVKDSSGRITNFVAVKDEISDRKSMEQRLRIAARTDTLTGLANRSVINERLYSVMNDNARDGDTGFAVLFLDFDRFKMINDSLGHDAGDELLKQIASRLHETMAGIQIIENHLKEYTIARFGGDEFVILLDRINSLEDTLFVGDRVLDELRRPYQLKGYDIISTASMGIVVGGLGQGGEDEFSITAADFLRDGDTAMYEAKLAGKGCYRVFDAPMRQRVQSRLGMESDLRKAVANGELYLEYQPIVDLLNADIDSLEVLVRWKRPMHGFVSPAEFIPIAEESGIIHEIGSWVLRAACTQFVQWRQHNPMRAPKSISVNLSRGQFNRTDLCDEVGQILKDTGMPPGCLHLEVTETAVMSDIDHAIQVLEKLKALHIKIDMDDFGTGQSSLACLRELPFDTLKIDRAFVAGLENNREMAAMIQAVIDLAYNLGIAVTAEGIETKAQLIILQTLDCGFAQGFLFSKPLPADQVEKFEIPRDLVTFSS